MTAFALLRHGFGRSLSIASRFLMLAIMATLSHAAVEAHIDDLESHASPARPAAHSEQFLIKGPSGRPGSGVNESGKTVAFAGSGHASPIVLSGTAGWVLLDEQVHQGDMCALPSALRAYNHRGHCGARDPPRA